VAFDTDLPTVGEVRWGLDEGYGRLLTDAPPQTHHALRLTGLKPGTSYHYKVSVRPTPAAVASVDGLPLMEGIHTPDAAFHTPPQAGKPLRFVVYGDVRSGHDVHAVLNQRIAEEDPDLAILTGDLVDRGSDEGDWERFFEVAAGLLRQLAIFPAAGNHEAARLGRGMTHFLQYFRWPLRADEEGAGYYSFDAAGVHFVALDSNQYRSPRQIAWLDRDLGEARRKGARALFVYAHEPPYSTGLHGDSAVMIRDYVPILERHKVSMFFGGHDHHYERGRVGALDYVVTGGGGAELRTARCGVPGKRACPPHVLAFANEHHYVMVEVMPTLFRVCPKRTDGTPIEACATFPLKR
jgi:acid phosphatase type 7